MKKEEHIRRYGEESYEKLLEQKRAWKKAHKEQEKARDKKYREAHKEEKKAYNKKYHEEHPEEDNARSKSFREENPEQVIANNHEGSRKGGKRYEKHLKDNRTGLRGARNRIRKKHIYKYKPYKQIIAPDSQLHHEWIPQTDEYRGIALVEADPHRYGIIDVIEILDGEITLLTEEEIKKGRTKEKTAKE